MTKTWQLASLLAMAVTASAAAQHPTRAQAPTPHVKSAAPANKPTAETRGAESAEHLKSFRGVAMKLGMTPEQLQTAYEKALTTTPKLTRGQFIAANMLGHAGLANHKSIGQTLHSLGLSDQEAKDAEKAADRDVREADKAADKAAKPQDKKEDTKSQVKPDSGQ